MSIINQRVVSENEKKSLNREIVRNDAILDEISELGIGIQFFKEVVVDQLVFDYFFRKEEKYFIISACMDTNTDTASVFLFIDKMAYDLGIDDGKSINSLDRELKKATLHKIKDCFEEVYLLLFNRAVKRTDKIFWSFF